jgi:hypothetical protein
MRAVVDDPVHKFLEDDPIDLDPVPFLGNQAIDAIPGHPLPEQVRLHHRGGPQQAGLLHPRLLHAPGGDVDDVDDREAYE